MRIDSHLHVWTLSAPPYTHNDDMSTQRPQSPGLVGNLIRYMGLNQIDRTMRIQCTYHGCDNSYLSHCLQRFPDRLREIPLLDPRRLDAAGKLECLYRQHGV